MKNNIIQDETLNQMRMMNVAKETNNMNNIIFLLVGNSYGNLLLLKSNFCSRFCLQGLFEIDYLDLHQGACTGTAIY